MRTFTCATIMLVTTALSVPFAGTAFAQAGSTGGTIGKSDKSESGGEERPSLDHPRVKRQPSAVVHHPAAEHVSISGPWAANNGFTYHVTQSGSSFTWILGSEIAHGTINGDELHASWSGGFTMGSGTGRLSKDGLTITWDNGVIFVRK
jgi:hypothetical protein